jgi:OmpA-OmpF porin, OOP family
MKNFKFIAIVIILFLVTPTLDAQIKINLKNKVENEANKRANKKVDESVNSTFDDAENAIFGKKKNKNSKNKNQDSNEDSNENHGGTDNDGSNDIKVEDNQSGENSDSQVEDPQKPQNTMVWNKFDFVPGDKIIFEDAPSLDEENGEFPSRWDLVEGQIEIANVDGENVIMFIDGSPEITPYLKDADKDYLPEVFTIEFDIYQPANGNRFYLYLHDRKNQKGLPNHVDDIEINLNRVDVGGVVGEYESEKNYDNGNWIHVSIAYTKGKLKIYLDDTRLINIPRLEGSPSGFTIKCYWADATNNKAWYLQNIRIAEGGVKYYDRAMQDGKIIVNGIRFDVGKATLKPESMGPLNEILYVMQKNPEINFSVEGHTDSDGDETTNQKLSEERAKTVMDKLIEMGIDKSRLSSKGFGESKPMVDNTSAEGKAQNRRVEFVKF